MQSVFSNMGMRLSIAGCKIEKPLPKLSLSGGLFYGVNYISKRSGGSLFIKTKNAPRTTLNTHFISLVDERFVLGDDDGLGFALLCGTGYRYLQ